MMRLRDALRAAALFCVLLGSAHAETTYVAQQDMYLDAMHSLEQGKQSEAIDTLTRMIEKEPQHAGAWLDLALIHCELGHAAEAERLFQIIESRFSPPPGIREIIASRREVGCKGWQPKNQFSVMLARGFDSNVNQGASDPNFSIGSGASRIDLQLAPEYLPQRDRYSYLAAEFTRDLNPKGSIVFAQLRSRQNDSLSRYSTSSVRLGLEHPWNLGNWLVRGMTAAEFLTLGGQLYQRNGQLQARFTPPLTMPDRFRFNILAGLTRIEYPTLTNFNSTTFELSGLTTYRTDRMQLHFNAGYQSDQGGDTRPGGDRNGWFGSIQTRYQFNPRIIGEAGWSRQSWIGDTTYSPGLIDQVRHQNTQLLRAALIFPVNKQQSLQVEWRQVRNDENISIFQYNSQLLQISWRWQNF